MEGKLDNKTEEVVIDSGEFDTGVKLKPLLKEIQFYALPIFSFVLFLLIIIGAVVPSFANIFSTINDVNSLRQKDAELKQSIQRLIDLRSKNLQQQAIIDKINKIVPTGKSEVVSFRNRVATTTVGSGVELKNAKTGEVVLSTGNTDDLKKTLRIIQIPTEFNMQGQFNNLRNFFNALYDGIDFFIVDKMDLRRNIDPSSLQYTNEWLASTSLVKYQFFAEEGVNVEEYYSSIKDDQQPDQTVITFLTEKFINLDQSFNTEENIVPTPSGIPTPTVTTTP